MSTFHTQNSLTTKRLSEASSAKIGSLIVGICLLFGCTAEERSDRCQLNSDCAQEGQRCLDGLCQLECAEDVDCDNDLNCINGACVEVLTACRADEDCPFAYQCAQGLCQRIEDFCLRNSDCQSGQVCDRETERCLDGNSVRCIDSGDCFGDEACVQGICQQPAETSCTSTGDCFAGEICEDGECVADPGPECLRNSDCPDNLICVNGTCEPECEDDRDCPSNEQCANSVCEMMGSTSNGTTGDMTSTSNGTSMPPETTYSGPFRLSSTGGIKRCNDAISLQYEARDVTANQSNSAYTFIFPTSVYDGTINNGSFTVSWSGFQSATQACGDMNSANTYTGVFSGPDLFQGTLTSQFFFQIGSCNCVLSFPITGTRQ